jgi:hypothetical protein
MGGLRAIRINLEISRVRYTEEPVFSEQNQQVNVRQLRDGRTQEGVCESLEGSHLQFRLVGAPAPGAFNSGELVEVRAARTLYLGEITGRQDNLILIAVEHALNREALAAIHEVWHRPDGV